MSSGVPALARDGSSGSGMLTPKRPPRPPRAHTGDGTPARGIAKPALAGQAERMAAHEGTDYDLTPRKGHLPTPPHSETTSSGSGSARADLAAPSASSAGRQSETGSTSLSSGSMRRMKAADVQISPPASPPQSLTRGELSRRSPADAMRPDSARRAPPSAAQNGTAGRASGDLMRRSARHEQEITQIRSESRAGRWGDDSDEETGGRTNGQLASRPSPGRRGTASTAQQRSRGGGGGGAESSTATDTSGTEGAGSAAGRRRRKKSSAASSSNSRNNAAAARHARQQSASQQAEEWVRSDSRRSTLDYGPARRIISPRIGSEASTERFSGRFAAQWSDEPVSSPTEAEKGPGFASATLSRISPRRAPLPLEFREAQVASGRQSSLQSRFRSSSITSASEEQDTSTESVTAGSRDHDAAFEQGSVLGNRDSRRVPSSFARRRHVSDAHELPNGDYDGRAGTQSSRLSVDSSSASRHLARVRHSASATAIPRSPREEMPELPPLSPSEIIRQRKVSSSSARSTGSASELLRTASRASARLVHGRDVFDEAPPLSADRADRLNTLRQRQEQMRSADPDWRSDFDELRSKIDELAVTSTPRTDSRASSRISVRPASTFGPRTHDALGIDRTTSRASFTDPRPSATLQRRRPSVTERHDVVRGAAPRNEDLGIRSQSRASELPLRRFTTTNDFSERAPVTPDPSVSRLGSQSAVLPSSARFASSTSSSATKLSDANMMHERNLQNAFSIFDRHFVGPGTPSTPARGAESGALVDHFREVTAAATRINVDLRAIVQEVVEAQIDAELAENTSGRAGGAAAAFERIDRALSQVLRQSDDQLRSLCDGLIAFTRAERERDRIRRGSENGSTSSRPISRVSLYTSPVRPTAKGEARQVPPSRSGKHSPTASSTSEARSAHSHSSAGDRAASSPSVRAAAEQRHRRHFTDATASPAYASPTPATLKLAASSPTLNPPPRLRSTLSRAHGRTASEVMANASHAENGVSSGRQRESTASTVRPAENLSPQRATLSFPTVSSATATILRAEDDSLSRAHARASEPVALAAAAAGYESPGASISRRNTISTSPVTQRMSRDFTRPPRHDLMQPDEQQDESGTSTQSASTMRRMLSLSRRR